MSEGLGNMEGVVTGTKCLDNNGTGSELKPNECMEDMEVSNMIDFGSENTQMMNIENMVGERYKEFNKTLSDLVCLVNTYSADKKTIKYIKNEYLKLYMKYFDVTKYIYGLDIANESTVPGTSSDRFLLREKLWSLTD